MDNKLIDIDVITKDLENNHTWTIFKIIITTGGRNLKIQNIVSNEYINNENNETNALLLNEEEAQIFEINNNENININNENTYYVRVKDITTKKDGKFRSKRTAE